MKKIPFIILFLTIVSFASAENKTYLKDGQIVVDTKEDTKLINYSKEDAYISSGKKKWEVKEEVSTVSEALKVYKEKGRALYHKKLYIINKEDGTQSLVIEFETDDRDETIIFSPDSDLGYYISLNDSGRKSVYGVDVSGGSPFKIGDGKGFQLITCQDNISYIIVEDTFEQDRYAVYKQSGDLVKTVILSEAEDDLGFSICLEL